MSFFRSIKFRLTLWYVSVIVLLMVIVGGTAYSFQSYNLYKNLDDSMRSRALQLEDLLAADPGAVALRERFNETVLVYSTDGKLLRRFGPTVEVRDIGALLATVTAEETTVVTTVTSGKEEVRLLVSLFNAGPGNRQVLALGRSTAEEQEVLARLRYALVFGGLAMTVYAGIFGFLRSSQALRPVNRITAMAREISETELGRRISVYTRDELGSLAVTLNRMMERLEGAFNRQRQFTADASHELRTPLSVITAESTLALSRDRTEDEYRRSIELISQEAGRMSDMIEELLFLARADSGEGWLENEKVNLQELLAEISSEMEVLCQEKGLKFRADLPEGLAVIGDKAKLRRLFVNLLQNAIRYTVDGAVELSLAGKDGMAAVAVSDTGIGIPAEHLPHIFERFYRVDKARSRAGGGWGLGLAIARQIAEAHGGEIKVWSEVGRGSTFRVILPLLKEAEPRAPVFEKVRASS